MNVEDLFSAPQNDELLKDENWQKAIFYDYTTSSKFWNRAIVITLLKSDAKTIAIALIYLLQKQAHALQLWHREWGITTPTIQAFINFFTAEKSFTNTYGKLVTIEHFWEQYSSTIAGITSEPSFEFSKNDVAVSYDNVISKEDIIQVICFDDTLYEQNFLFETKNDWVLYHWSSGV